MEYHLKKEKQKEWKKIKLKVKNKIQKSKFCSVFFNGVKSARILIEEPAFEECLKDLLVLLLHWLNWNCCSNDLYSVSESWRAAEHSKAPYEEKIDFFS